MISSETVNIHGTEAADALEDARRWFDVSILAGEHGDYNIGL